MLTSQGRQPVSRGYRRRAPPALAVTTIQATRPTPLSLPVLPAPAPTPSSQSLAKRPASRISRKAVCQVASAPSLTTRASTSGVTSGTSTRRHTRRIMESSSDLDSDNALPKRAYQELLEAFHQRHCISINLADASGTKIDNGFTELIDYAITHHYPTLEFLSTTGRTPFVEDMIRKYEHVIRRAIQNIETHDFWNMHCNMLIFDRERRKCRGKGQANAQVSFEAAKRAPVGYYYRCKYTSVHILAFIYF